MKEGGEGVEVEKKRNNTKVIILKWVVNNIRKTKCGKETQLKYYLH